MNEMHDMYRQYKALVWVGDDPGIRVELYARNLEEATLQLKERYGREAVISLWNDDDAQKPR